MVAQFRENITEAIIVFHRAPNTSNVRDVPQSFAILGWSIICKVFKQFFGVHPISPSPLQSY